MYSKFNNLEEVIGVLEVYPAVKILGAIFGSSIATIIISKWLGKKKEDIEIALKYQEYYQKHIDDLKKDMKELKDEVHNLSKMVEHQEETINNQNKNLSKWENENKKLRITVKEREKVIARQEEEIDKLSKSK